MSENILAKIGRDMIICKLHNSRRRKYERAILDSFYREPDNSTIGSIREYHSYLLKNELNEQEIDNEVKKVASRRNFIG